MTDSQLIRRFFLIALVYNLVCGAGAYFCALKDPDSYVNTGKMAEFGCIPNVALGIGMGDCP